MENISSECYLFRVLTAGLFISTIIIWLSAIVWQLISFQIAPYVSQLLAARGLTTNVESFEHNVTSVML